ncbi:MAG TPA: hypothetical protein VHW69_02985 [Rhizomicrobium sp.]|jgi:NADPH-dependent 2,4-dienoyl-CoA reductase/sulfur reductase-like enzyme|nr:hypothetical protein [Rhizomicrobium sp.]
MNKYLMLSAAAVLASTGASAGNFVHSFQLGTAGGASYCDGGTVYSNGSTNYAWTHVNNDCFGSTSQGNGLSVKSKYGAGELVSDNSVAKNTGIYSQYFSYQLPAKWKSGKGKWELFVGLNGTTSFLGLSGVIFNVPPGHKTNAKKSSTSALKELIAVHKASMHD